MHSEITLEKLEQELDFFHKMYDIVRIVDPINKKVLDQRSSELVDSGEACFKYWESGKICDNCVSIRAHKDNKSYIKLEQNPNSTMLVTAIPIESAGFSIVLELLKDATNSMMIGTGDYNDGNLMINVISQLNNMVIMDSLTNLYNRRFIDERLPVDIVKATISDSPISIIFMDLDDLKLLNDEHGHIVGDLALSELGNLIKGHIRESVDWAARYGGDEFIICLNNTDNEAAHNVANRIQKGLEDISTSLKLDMNLKISASMGIHTMHREKLTPEEFINYADKAMYRVKNINKDTPT